MSGGGLSIFFCLCSLSKWSSCNYFQRFQSREEKKKRLSLTAQCFLKVHVLVWIQETQKEFAELQYMEWLSEMCKLHARNLCFDTCEGEKKKSNTFLFPCGCVCLFVCSSVWRPSHCLHRRSAVSWLALLLQRLSELPVGDWSTARPRSEDTLWQVCVWRTIFRFARAYISDSKYLDCFHLHQSLCWRLRFSQKRKKTLFFCKNSVVKLILLQFCRFFFYVLALCLVFCCFLWDFFLFYFIFLLFHIFAVRHMMLIGCLWICLCISAQIPDWSQLWHFGNPGWSLYIFSPDWWIPWYPGPTFPDFHFQRALPAVYHRQQPFCGRL